LHRDLEVIAVRGADGGGSKSTARSEHELNEVRGEALHVMEASFLDRRGDRFTLRWVADDSAILAVFTITSKAAVRPADAGNDPLLTTGEAHPQGSAGP
jgi:hypothetical protein